jgi:hypothetical protein
VVPGISVATQQTKGKEEGDGEEEGKEGEGKERGVRVPYSWRRVVENGSVMYFRSVHFSFSFFLFIYLSL